jgi:hypothetical protein
MRRLLFALLLTAATTHAQWQLQDARTTADLRGIDNVGGGVAWASGSDGTILRTEDAGFVWQVCAKPPNAEHLDFRAIQASDNNTAIIMSSGKGDLSRLYKTTDGCQTWKLLFTNPDKDGFWDALKLQTSAQDESDSPTNRVAHPLAQPKGGVSRVVARDPDHRYGILLGDPVNGVFAIWETHDSGSHWQRFNANDPKHQPKAKQNESLFAASNEALTVPGNNAAFTFVTGGAATRICSMSAHSPFDAAFWYAVDCHGIPFPSGSSAGAFAIGARIARNDRGVIYEDFMIVGGDYARPAQQSASFFVPGAPMLLFGGHGTTATTPPHGYRSAVAYDPKSKTWITVGPNGTDISTDDGRNWRALLPSVGEAPDTAQHWNALSLPFAVGPHGRIATLRPSSLGSAANEKN